MQLECGECDKCEGRRVRLLTEERNVPREGVHADIDVGIHYCQAAVPANGQTVGGKNFDHYSLTLFI